MARKEIGIPLDRNNRNNHNANYEELYRMLNTLQTQINDLVLDAGESNQEVAQARNGHQVLGDRLNEFDEQLAETESEVSEFKIDTADRFNEKRDKTQSVDLNEFTPRTLAAIQNKEHEETFDLLSIPRDQSVTPIKTTFIKMSSNIFNKKDVNSGYFLDGEGKKISDSNFSYSNYIPISGTSLSIVNIHRIEYSDQNYEIIQSNHLIPNDINKVNIPDDTMYVRVNVENTRLDSAQMNYGDELIKYEEYYEKLIGVNIDEGNIKEGSITSSKRTILGERSAVLCLEATPNIINEGEKRSIEFFKNTRFYSGKKQYQIEGKTTLQLSKSSDHNLIFLNIETGNFTVLNLINGLQSLSENDVYVSTITFSPNGNIRSVDIGCDYRVNGYPVIDRDGSFDGAIGESPYLIQDLIPSGWYKASDFKGHEAPNHYLDDVTLDYIYQPFEDGLNDEPEYVSKEIMGKDESGEYDVIKYELKPKIVEVKDYNNNLPKIIITGNIHGEEKGSSISISNFVEDLLNNWEEDPVLEWIRFNLHLIFVPVNNPYGFVNSQKKNYNGVDLNRNFSYNWEHMTDTEPGDNLYRGPEPFSEKETQYIRDLINDNLDAMAFYDYHMNGTSGEIWEQSYWTILKGFKSKKGHREMQEIAISDISKVTREAHKRFDVPKSSGFIGYTTISNPATSTTYAFSKDIPSATIECARKFVGEENVYSEGVIQLNAEYIGNKILTTVRHLI